MLIINHYRSLEGSRDYLKKFRLKALYYRNTFRKVSMLAIISTIDYFFVFEKMVTVSAECKGLIILYVSAVLC